jgi:hypothetical protein
MGAKPRPTRKPDLKKASEHELFLELMARGYRFGIDKGETQMLYVDGEIIPHYTYEMWAKTDSWFQKFVEAGE